MNLEEFEAGTGGKRAVSTASTDQLRMSVVIPAFNVESCLGDALDSLAAQTRPPHEVIVVDDGSTDRTPDVVRRHPLKPRYVRQENAGPSAARNRGIEEAGSDWVAFLDSDDLWLPQKLERECEVLERNPDLVWITCNHYLQYFGDESREPRFDLALAENYLGIGDTFDSFVRGTSRGLGWDPTAFTIRREVLLELGGFEVGLNYAEDLELFLRIAHRHPRIGFVTEPLAVHLVDRPDGLCRVQSIRKMMQTLRDIYERHQEPARETGSLRYLQVTLRPPVHDAVRTLLSGSRTSDARWLADLFQDILGRSYVRTIGGLTRLPKKLRERIYSTFEWRIRGLSG